MPGGPCLGHISTSVIVWVGPLKPRLGVSLLLIFAEWPRRTPFSGAEKPPVAFICELKKQVSNGLVLRGQGQSAISDRAGVAYGHLKSQRNITRIQVDSLRNPTAWAGFLNSRRGIRSRSPFNPQLTIPEHPSRHVC